MLQLQLNPKPESNFINFEFNDTNGQLKLMTVEGETMEPTLPRGAVAILKKIPPERMQEGLIYCIVENTIIPTPNGEVKGKYITFGRRQLKTRKGVWLIFDNKRYKKKFVYFDNILEVYLVIGYFKKIFPF